MSVYALKVGMVAAGVNYMENVFHYDYDDSLHDPFSVAGAIITAWQTNVGGDFAAILGNDVHVNYYACKRIYTPGYPSAFDYTDTVGSAIAIADSSAVAMDVRWITAAAARPGHTFIGGFADIFLTGQLFDPSLATVGTFISDMLTPLNVFSANAVFSLYTRKTHAVNHILHGALSPKPTAMNRRTLPVN